MLDQKEKAVGNHKKSLENAAPLETSSFVGLGFLYLCGDTKCFCKGFSVDVVIRAFQTWATNI